LVWAHVASNYSTVVTRMSRFHFGSFIKLCNSPKGYCCVYCT
jgi:hypothetical protein